MRKVTHSFEVHSNESACRKSERLGLEQVTYSMSWYGFFCLCQVAYTFGYVMEMCYCIKLNLWMNYCSCWHCDDMMLGMWTQIPIIVYLHRTKIFWLKNRFARSDNLSINCCVILKCIWFWYEHDNIKSMSCCVSCVNGSIFLDSTNKAILSLIPSRTTWCIHQTCHKGLTFVTIG